MTVRRTYCVVLSIAMLVATAVTSGCGSDSPSTGLKQDGRGLKKGSQYYVYVDYIEVHPNKPNGDSWDSGSSGPDVCYNIVWQDNEIFSSSKRSDTLVAEWKAKEMGMAFGDESLIKGESSVVAARITAEPGTLTFNVWDSDLTVNDEIGAVKVPIEELEEGRNEYGDTQAIKKIVIVATLIPPIDER